MIEPAALDTAGTAELIAAARVWDTLARMARLRAVAYEARLAGYIGVACKKDAAIDRLYNTLPDSVKW